MSFGNIVQHSELKQSGEICCMVDRNEIKKYKISIFVIQLSKNYEHGEYF